MELTGLLLRDLKNGKFELAAEYVQRTEKYIIVVPRGFITNYANIPRVLRVFILPYGKHSGASIIHDWLYSRECQMNITREEADDIFLEILEEENVAFITRMTMFQMVRKFGEKYYKK